MPTQWSWADPVYANVPGVDADAEWALGDGKAQFFPAGRQDRWIPVLVQLHKPTMRAFIGGRSFIDDARSLSWWQDSVRVSPLYGEDQQIATQATHFVAMVRQGFFEFLRQNDRLRAEVARVTIGLPLDAECFSPDFAPTAGARSQP